MTPSHILDLFWHCLAHLCWVTPIFQLASACWNWKEMLKTKYFAHNLSCVPLVSYLSLLDDRSLFKNLSRGAQTRLCVTRPSHRPISHLTHFTHRESNRNISENIPKVFNICLPGCHTVNISEFCKNIYKHLTRQNWLTNWYQHSTTSQHQQTKEEENICL